MKTPLTRRTLAAFFWHSGDWRRALCKPTASANGQSDLDRVRRYRRVQQEWFR